MVKGFRHRLSDYFKGSLSSPKGVMTYEGRRRKTKTPRRNMYAEICETRAMLSATVLTGTAGNDVFTLTYDSLNTSGEVDVTLSTNGGAATNLGTFSMSTGLSLRGLAGTDSVKVVGTNGADIYTVSGAKIDMNGSEIMLAGVENRILEGGAGPDTYRMDADAQLGRVTINESGGGLDLLDFSLTTNTRVEVNLSQATQQNVNSNLQLVLSAGNTIENLIGGAGNDVLLGNALDNRLVGGPGNDILNGAAGSDDLRGGTGNDTYVFGAAGAAETDTVMEASGGGIDLLTFAAVTSNVRVNLGLTTNQTVHFNRVLRLNASNTIENLTGGQGNDTLVGNVLHNVLRGGSGDDLLSGRAGSDTLTGGMGDDTYNFEFAGSAELDRIVELAGEGLDTVQFSSVSANVELSLAAGGTQTVHTNRQLNIGASIENITGGSGDDTLTGNGAANILIGGPGDDLLIGGRGNDTYKFAATASTEVDTVVEQSAAGRDTLDFSELTTAVTVDLSAANSQSVHRNRRVVLQSPMNFENVIGGTANDQLTGNAAANVLTGGAGNDILAGAGGSDTLRGGSGNDRYTMQAATSMEVDSIVEARGGGFDVVDFSAVAANVNISLATTTTQNVHTNRQIRLSDAISVEGAIGGSGNDRLSGNAVNNQLVGNAGNDTLIGGRGSDTLQGGTGNDSYTMTAATSLETDSIFEPANGGIDTLNFSLLNVNIAVNLGTTELQTVHTHRNLRLSSAMDFEDIIGGSGHDTLTGNDADNWFNGGAGNDSMLGRGGNDVYYFSTASSAEVDRITELADSGTDTLSFAALTTGVTVNLGTTAAQNIHANRQLILNSAASLENVIGGAGNDSLTGNARSNVLVGNAGNDRLVGLQGRDILIGGLGADVLLGGGDDDILIAGRTTSDQNIENLLSLQTQWISSNTYNTRISNLRNGAGSPAVSLKARVNVLNDGGADDRLTGGADQDWYFRAIDDVITDLTNGERIDVL